MTRVKCINPQCPKKNFEWDESKNIARGGRIAQPHEAGAVRVIAMCPHCYAENAVWVIKANKPDEPVRY